MPKKMTQKEFIEKAINVHEDKYSYERVIYINSITPVEIFCKKCREYFLQKPVLHCSGRGHKKCAFDEGNLRKTLTTEQFVEDAKIC